MQACPESHAGSNQENDMMSKPLVASAVLSVLLLGVLSGCGNRNQTAGGAGSDSILSSNPQEQSQGTLTPQQKYRPANQAPPPVRRAPSSGGATVRVPSGTP